MALPTTGQISLAAVAGEFGGSNPLSLSQFYRNGGRVPANNTGVPTAGTISLQQFRGTQKVTAGSQTFSTPGTYSFTVPAYNTLTAVAEGAGGSGGTGVAGLNGTQGGASSFNGNVVANGGGGGASSSSSGAGTGGAAGTASGGDTNTSGSQGTNAANGAVGGVGANSPSGANGGTGGVTSSGAPPTAGGTPGAGGGGGAGGNGTYVGGGGSGARAIKAYSVGQLTPGATVTVVVGGGGVSPNSGYGSQYNGGKGGDGRVTISWS